EVTNPARRSEVVGHVTESTPLQVKQAITIAAHGGESWSGKPPLERARVLESAADLLEERTLAFMALLIRASGKTYANALAEVREAVDYLRYYSLLAKTSFKNETHKPLGPVVCISPWNFPLAIFTGQITGALAAGNTVLAKPAKQTPLVAYEMVRL